ncbi:MAG TPA: hypothetical protein VNH83_27380 [Bryobacteraceae bacterium]|nr:hypothetical protein [Bryobacteraceae bacterium]
MQAGVPKVSAELEKRINQGLLDRLPVTFSAYWFEQFRDWDLLFPAEKDYYERLFSLLDRSERAAVDRLFAPLRQIELRMGVNEKNWPRREFTLDQVDFLNRNPQYPKWRAAVSDIFKQIDPALDEEVDRVGRPRLAIVISPSELPVASDRMWMRIRNHGTSLPVETPDNPEDYLPLLLTGARRADPAPSVLELYAARTAGSRYQAWTVETGNALASVGVAGDNVVHCSYAGLEKYRKRLMTEVDRLVRSEEIRGPRELSARLKELKVAPSEAGLAQDPILAEFARATLLSGNGTLLLNNTFVEWAAIQAIRRARPAVQAIAFGIRNKIKPFSGLLIYADQDRVSPIPPQMDTLGSYVDLEVFYQYVWQQFEKYPEYRGKTAYLFAGDGLDQMLVVAPPDFLAKLPPAPASLAQINSLMKDWLSIS